MNRSAQEAISEATDIVAFISDNYTDYVFLDTERIVIDTIAVDIELRRFDLIIEKYGLLFVLYIIKFYEEQEYWEICSVIKEQIELLNLKKKMHYVTSLDDFFVKI